MRTPVLECFLLCDFDQYPPTRQRPERPARAIANYHHIYNSFGTALILYRNNLIVNQVYVGFLSFIWNYYFEVGWRCSSDINSFSAGRFSFFHQPCVIRNSWLRNSRHDLFTVISTRVSFGACVAQVEGWYNSMLCLRFLFGHFPYHSSSIPPFVRAHYARAAVHALAVSHVPDCFDDFLQISGREKYTAVHCNRKVV